ncbi:MAG: thiol reductant exporter subunit CydC [Actinomycetota bacterium]|jgi:ATP-binding cassette, subfamily C, bacterial CydC
MTHPTSIVRTALGSPFAGFALMLLSSISGVALLSVSAWLIIRASQQPPILYLQMAIVGVRGFALARAFFRYTGRLVSHHNAFTALALVRVQVMTRLIRVMPGARKSFRTGSVLSHLVRDVDSLQFAPLRIMEPLLSALVVFVLAVVGISLVDSTAGIAVVVVAVATLAVSSLAEWKLATSSLHEVPRLRAELATMISEMSGRTAVLAAYGVSESSRDSITAQSRRLMARETTTVWARSISNSAVIVGSGIAAILALLLTVSHGERFVDTSGGVSDEIAPFIGVTVLCGIALFEVLAQVPAAISGIVTLRAAQHRIETEIPNKVPREIPAEPDEPIDIPTSPAGLVLRNFTSVWPGQTEPSFAPVSVNLTTGDCLLVSGDSGVGKSTFAYALIRFLEHSGDAYLNGVDVRHASPRNVRRHIGLCEQQPHIFTESLRQNLLFADDTSENSELWDVLERVRLADWARSREGLDTQLGENGSLISGGQAHRIAIARMLLAKHLVLIIDEPLAHLDRVTAEDVLDDLLAATKNSIVVIISHDEITHPRITQRVKIEART